jgi:hypothetical protein
MRENILPLFVAAAKRTRLLYTSQWLWSAHATTTTSTSTSTSTSTTTKDKEKPKGILSFSLFYCVVVVGVSCLLSDPNGCFYI